ncbi:response regulator [Candidatus Gracilibacteria bacterium]|nr:response regulator [Candidatus Gracilibacteria bacterium]
MQSPSILFVDDEAVVRRVIGDGLAQAGYRVHVAADEKAAEVLASTENIDLAIVDLHIGESDGITLMSKLRARARTCRSSSSLRMARCPAPSQQYAQRLRTICSSRYTWMNCVAGWPTCFHVALHGANVLSVSTLPTNSSNLCGARAANSTKQLS